MDLPHGVGQLYPALRSSSVERLHRARPRNFAAQELLTVKIAQEDSNAERE